MAAKIPSAAEYKAQLFDPVFWNEETLRTVDPSEVAISRSAHPLVPIVSLVGDEPTDKIPPKGLILAPFHVPAYLNAKPDEALAYVLEMAASIRKTIDEASGGEGLKFVIWSGMGGSIEDKYAAVAAGMMGNDGSGVQFFGLDDINGESLGHVFKQIEAASGGSLVAGLRRTVCVAQALGMTSLEPVFNVQQALLPTFEALGLKPAQHFWKVCRIFFSVCPCFCCIFMLCAGIQVQTLPNTPEILPLPHLPHFLPPSLTPQPPPT